MGNLMAGSVLGRQVGEYIGYRKYKKAPEPGEGKIGVQKMTKKQIRDKQRRDAAKTPLNQQTYS